MGRKKKTLDAPHSRNPRNSRLILRVFVVHPILDPIDLAVITLPPKFN